MRRRIPWGVLAVLFILVPLAEIYVLIQVGHVVGALWTVLLLIAVSVLGSYLIKREGGRAWRALQTSLQTHRMPTKELADGALILIGGTLLLTPGFLSDIAGLFFILPFTRPLARRMLTGFVTRKFLASTGIGATNQGPGVDPSVDPGVGREPRTRQRPGPDSVVQGEVVD